MPDPFALTPDRAAALAQLPMRSIQREYPNAPQMLLEGPGDLRSPREIHPSFYGCYDWHSAVHGHWMLVRLLKMFVLPEAQEIRRLLNQNLTTENLRVEADYVWSHRSFERTYGWAWLLKLSEELDGWDDIDGRRWRLGIAPLEELIVDGYLAFLPVQTYPIRVGTHSNTAFGLTFAFDYAVARGHRDLEQLIRTRARDYYIADPPAAVAFEPGGNDFLSPSLVEADLMRRVLDPPEFTAWFHRFLPDISRFLETAIVADRSDGQIAHLDGLNLTRAWCLRGISDSLPVEDLLQPTLRHAAEAHAKAGLEGVESGHYAGEHWLASFAVYLLLQIVYLCPAVKDQRT